MSETEQQVPTRPLTEGEARGTIAEALPNTMFRVLLEDGRTVLGFLSGRMRLHRIKVLVGDRVILEDNPYGGKLRIVKRL